jgi:hypothetical protein
MGKGQNESGMAKATSPCDAFAIPDFNSLLACGQDNAADTIVNQ